MKLKPLGARALVKMVEGEEQTAEVVAVGDSDEVKVSVGDVVVLAKYSRTEVKVEGEKSTR